MREWIRRLRAKFSSASFAGADFAQAVKTENAGRMAVGEIDLHEGGFISGATDPDRIMSCNLHTAGNSQVFFNTGVSLSADYRGGPAGPQHKAK